MDSSKHREWLRDIKSKLTEVSCMSHDCVFGHPGGVGIGVCHCLENLSEDRNRLREVRQTLWDIRSILRGADL